MATRSGTSTGIAGARHIRLDASDADALSAVADGASVLYNCENPDNYTMWETMWPPLDSAMLTAAEDPSAHGRTWIVPSNPPRSQKPTLADVLGSVGKLPVPVTTLRGGALAAAALFSPMLRELSYQWTSPYLIDDSAAREHFGFEPTPWGEVCLRTANP